MVAPNGSQNIPNHVTLSPWSSGANSGMPHAGGGSAIYGYTPPSSSQPPSTAAFFHLGTPTHRPSRAVMRQTPQGLTRNGKLIKSYDVPVPTRHSHPVHKAAPRRHVSPIEEAKVGSLTGAAKRAPTRHTKKRKPVVKHKTHKGPEAGNGPYYGNVLANGSSGIDTSATNTSTQSDANASAIAALQSQLQADEGTMSALQATVDAINQAASAPTTPTSSSSSFLSSTTGKVILVAGVALGAWWYIRHRKGAKPATKSSAKKKEGVKL